MAALAADMEAAAGGGREVEKGFAALLRGDGGGLTHSGCSRLLGQRRRGGLLAKSCCGRPHNSGGLVRCQPFASGTAAHFIEADSLSLLVWHNYNILGGSRSTAPASDRRSTCRQLLSTALDSLLFLV